MLMLSKHLKRPDLKKTSGFTIVELLIVIVVIGILAAITIVAYNGITTQATNASLSSDLKAATTKIEADKATTGSYPASAAAADGGAGLKASPTNTISYYNEYRGQANSFCVAAVSSGTNTKKYASSSITGGVKEGVCDRATVSKGGSCGAGCNYVSVNTVDFTAGSYSVRCFINGSGGSTYSVSLPTTGIYQLSCTNSYAGSSVYVIITGWGQTPVFTW